MKSISSDSAVSEVMGHAIILAITIVGISMIVLVGVPSILKLEDLAKIRNAEQTSTVLDSLASSTILGDSPQQVINMNLDGGILSIKTNGTNSTSYITIKSMNNTFNLRLPMGKIEYRLGERMVGYEGGGIWSKYPTGSVMLSPPEFHYNGRTLTLPVINLIGNGSIGGKGTAAISLKKNSSMVLFPNTSIDSNRTNPLNYNLNGKVYINITSDYYDAWAEYAKNLIYTKVNTDPKNKTTIIELLIVPNNFGAPMDLLNTNPINLRGIPATDDTPLENFSFTIYSTQWNSIRWDLRAQNGNKKLIFFIWKKVLTIGYMDTDLGVAEEWGSYTYTPQTDNNGDEFIYVDLLNESINLTYGDQGYIGANQGCPSIPRIQPGDFNATSFSWADGPFITGQNKSLYNLTQHYIEKMAEVGDISFNQCQSGSNGPDPGSTALVNYNPMGGITFLYIANNTADVSIK